MKMIWSMTTSLEALMKTKNSMNILQMKITKGKNLDRWLTINQIAWSNHNTSPLYLVEFFYDGEQWQQKYSRCQLKSPDQWFTCRLWLVGNCTFKCTSVVAMHLYLPNPGVAKYLIDQKTLITCTFDKTMSSIAFYRHLARSKVVSPAHWNQLEIVKDIGWLIHGICHIVLSRATTSNPIQQGWITGIKSSSSDLDLRACYWASCALSMMD